MIFVTAAKFSTDSILNASMELRRRGFIVEIEKEDKDSTKCYFLLSLTPSLIQSISFAKDLPVFKHLGNYSAIQQLIILNSAVDIIMESCTFLEGRDAWVVQEKQKYDSIFKEVKQTDKLLGINNYFGPQIALYFGWLSHYTELLLFPSLWLRPVCGPALLKLRGRARYRRRRARARGPGNQVTTPCAARARWAGGRDAPAGQQRDSDGLGLAGSFVHFNTHPRQRV